MENGEIANLVALVSERERQLQLSNSRLTAVSGLLRGLLVRKDAPPDVIFITYLRNPNKPYPDCFQYR